MSAEHEYAIELQGVSFKRGARSIFDTVDIRIPRGKVTGIMGPVSFVGVACLTNSAC